MTERIDTWLLHLSAEECTDLLRNAKIGRLGVILDGKPMVFPIWHVYVDGSIAFPSNPGTKLHAALAWPIVAYEVDGVDSDGRAAWSVMVSGRAEEITDPDERRRLTAMRDAPWRNSPTLRWIRLVPEEITGRRILAEISASSRRP